MGVLEKVRGSFPSEGDSLLLYYLGKSPELRVIDFLLENTLFDFSKKEILEEIGMSKSTLYRILPKLLRMEIIRITRRIGKAPLYQINGESPVVKDLWNIEKSLILLNSIQQAPEKPSSMPDLSLTEKYYLLAEEGPSIRDHDL